MLNVILFNACLLLVCGYALWRGGGPEKWTAGSLILAAALTRLTLSPQVGRYNTVEYGTLAIDLVLLTALVAIAVRANRYWTLCLASIHLTAVLIHGARLIDPEMVPGMYQLLIRLVSYPTLIVVVVGAIRHQQRLAQHGADVPWS